MALPEIICSHEAALLIYAILRKHGIEMNTYCLLNDVTRSNALERRGYAIPKSQKKYGMIWFERDVVTELAHQIIRDMNGKARPMRRPKREELTFTDPDPFEDMLSALLH